MRGALCYQMIVTIFCLVFLFVTYATTNQSLLPITTIAVESSTNIWESYSMKPYVTNDAMVVKSRIIQQRFECDSGACHI